MSASTLTPRTESYLQEVARRLETINYEITCGIGPRVPRVYEGGEEDAA